MPRAAENSELLAERKIFRRRLLRWFQREGRDLPWRRTRDPYAILVSEIMLQQTQVATVSPYYERWLERFPNFKALADATETEVLRAWQGLGYYARARNLQAAARQVTNNFDGELPVDLATIRQLPGIGRYTAGAIASFAFDLPEPIVDANIARLLARLTNSRIPIDTSAGRAHLWRTAAKLLPGKNAGEYNSALMDLGALLCLPRQPRCRKCPVRFFCRAERPELLPIKKKRPRLIRQTEPHLFSRRGNDVLLEQSRGRWRGLWILPRLQRTSRHLPLLQLDFSFTHHRITLQVFAAQRPALPNDRQKWFSLQSLDNLPVPTPHRRALAQLLPNQQLLMAARLS